MSTNAILEKIAETLKPYERKGTVGSAITTGAMAGGTAAAGITGARMLKHKLTPKGMPGNVTYLPGPKSRGLITGTGGKAKVLNFNADRAVSLANRAKGVGSKLLRAGGRGLAIGGAVGLGAGMIRGTYRGLTGKRSVSTGEYNYRKDN